VWFWPGPDGIKDAATLASESAKGGWLWQKGALDFAGGTVVHINAGVAGLVGAYVVGKRGRYGKDSMAPHNLTFTMIGASLLWVGWFGFNAGSALEAGDTAALAFINTLVATAAAVLSWMGAEWLLSKRRCWVRPPSRRRARGHHAGLRFRRCRQRADPRSRRRDCLWGVNGLKKKLGADDALDVFGVHAVGGIWARSSPACSPRRSSAVASYDANKISADYSIWASHPGDRRGHDHRVVRRRRLLAYKLVGGSASRDRGRRARRLDRSTASRVPDLAGSIKTFSPVIFRPLLAPLIVAACRRRRLGTRTNDACNPTAARRHDESSLLSSESRFRWIAFVGSLILFGRARSVSSTGAHVRYRRRSPETGDWVVPRAALRGFDSFVCRPSSTSCRRLRRVVPGLLPAHDAARLAAGLFVGLSLFLALTAHEPSGRGFASAAVPFCSAVSARSRVCSHPFPDVALRRNGVGHLLALARRSPWQAGAVLVWRSKHFRQVARSGLARRDKWYCCRHLAWRTRRPAALHRRCRRIGPGGYLDARALYVRSPALFDEWLVNNFGRFLGVSRPRRQSHGLLRLYAALVRISGAPLAGLRCGPLGGVAVSGPIEATFSLPALLAVVTATVLGVAHDSRGHCCR
jgi:hypothetical protein